MTAEFAYTGEEETNLVEIKSLEKRYVKKRRNDYTFKE